MKLYIGIIEHEWGSKISASTSDKEVIADLATWCRANWYEVRSRVGEQPDSGTIEEDDQAIVDLYFSVPTKNEHLTLAEVELQTMGEQLGQQPKSAGVQTATGETTSDQAETNQAEAGNSGETVEGN